MRGGDAGCGVGMRDAGWGCGMRGYGDGFGQRLVQVGGMTNHTQLSFAEWEKTVGTGIAGDPLWTVQAYRIGVYAMECHTLDRGSNPALAAAAACDQLTRAIGSISANIAEGYSRSTLPARVRFYGYALGSAREAIAWYNAVRVELGAFVVDRQAVLIQVRRLLLTTLRRSRTKDPKSMLRDSD
jgi:four helix bundle protein